MSIPLEASVAHNVLIKAKLYWFVTKPAVLGTVKKKKKDLQLKCESLGFYLMCVRVQQFTRCIGLELHRQSGHTLGFNS